MLSWLVIPLFAAQANPAKPAVPDQSTRITAQKQAEAECPSLESRFQRHRVAPGETADSIARTYNLLPETLIGLNPALRNAPPVGTEILIPPLNGTLIQVPPGTTWQDLEAAYGVRASVLFELNGCQRSPTAVFLPGTNWSSRQGGIDSYTGLSGYPLPAIAPVGLSYGWQTDRERQSLFHSGIDLLAEPGTPVLAAEVGTVSYVGQEDNYGNLIVVEHEEGRQTRYAHLESIQVNVGQQVEAGGSLGTVGTTGKPDLAAPHLHFEVRYNSPFGWVAQDPEIHLKMGNQFEF